ncbi:MAG: ABC transporter substrate-binding protein, partial [Myxococcota bacterium]|nr:ABC transporter substrate-binding protein [Myxococcota bacterium]
SLLWACTGEREAALVVLVESAPQSLDPRRVTDDIGTKISHLIFAPLLSFDTFDLKPQLVLAESIEQVSSTRYDITLKKELRFHDGSALSSADVCYTFRSTPHVMRTIKALHCPDPEHIHIELEHPHAPFLMTLELGIVSEREASKQEPRLGAGPFMLRTWRSDDVVILDRFEAYTLGPPHIPSLLFRPIRDDNTRILALLGGSADLAVNNISPIMLPVLQRQTELTVATSPSIKYSYLMFNVREPPLNDRRVRQAIAYAIDREPIVEYKFRGLAELASGMLSPMHWAYQDKVPKYPRSLKKAKALLDEAGYTDSDGPGGQPRMRLSFLSSTSKLRRSIAQLFAAQLAELDIELDVQALEFGTFFAKLQGGQFELTSLQWPSPIDPDLGFVALHSSMIPEHNPDGRNRGGFSSPAIDAVLEMGRRTPSQDARAGFYRAAQVLAAFELPYVPLWHEDNICVMRKGLEDFAPTPNARLAALAWARWNPRTQ